MEAEIREAGMTSVIEALEAFRSKGAIGMARKTNIAE